MDDKVVIDSIGPTVLTINLSGATHGVSIATDVIRISGPGGTTEHNLDSLPIIYEATALAGKLTICDGAGKMVYCWRSSVVVRSMPSVSAEEISERSLSSSLGAAARTEMINPGSSLASGSSVPLGKRRSVSVRTGGTNRVPNASSTAPPASSSNLNNGMTDSRASASGDNLEESLKEPQGPVNEEPLIRFGRRLRELMRKGKWGEVWERTLCQDCQVEPDHPVVADCLHVLCQLCLERHRTITDEIACPTCKETMTGIQSCKGLLELRLGALWETDGHVKTEGDYIDLDDEDTEQGSGFTVAQKNFLDKT